MWNNYKLIEEKEKCSIKSDRKIPLQATIDIDLSKYNYNNIEVRLFDLSQSGQNGSKVSQKGLV